MPEPSILDERLAEIDRRLRVIQSGLVPVESEPLEDRPDGPEPDGPDRVHGSPSPGFAGAPAAPSLGAPSPPTPLRAAPVPELTSPVGADLDRLTEITEAHERLLELHRELLSQYAEVLERQAGESALLAVTAGPFSTAGAVREFERALSTLPGVTEVVVREYPGGDRVQLEVRLASG